jgi:NAD(P)-dependent dehydrogenase (short-subunit alcohol dehydrogenase family)
MMILKARTAGSNSHHFLIEGKDDSPERPAPVDPKALAGQGRLSDGAAYSQSKLVLTSWSHSLALSLKDDGPAIIGVNPGSMLGSKMVKEAFGVAGGDIAIGADILCSAALDDEFGTSSGQYFDNDLGRFASPHPDALDPEKSEEIVRVIETVLAQTTDIDQPK